MTSPRAHNQVDKTPIYDPYLFFLLPNASLVIQVTSGQYTIKLPCTQPIPENCGIFLTAQCQAQYGHPLLTPASKRESMAGNYPGAMCFDEVRQNVTSRNQRWKPKEMSERLSPGRGGGQQWPLTRNMPKLSMSRSSEEKLGKSPGKACFATWCLGGDSKKTLQGHCTQ